MKKRTLLFFAAAVAAVLIAVPFAFAQHLRRHAAGGPGGGEMMMFARLERAKDALGLSDQQVADIRAIGADLRTRNAPYREAVMGSIDAAAQTLLANPNDVAAARAQLDKEADARRQIEANRLEAASRALNVLTPEQRAKVAAFLQQRAARKSDR